MGIAGGLFPSPLHLLALTEAARRRWARAILVLVGPPILVDGVLLLTTFFFYQYVPHSIAHYVAYAGGAVLACFAIYSLRAIRQKSPEDMAPPSMVSYASVSLATMAELTMPGTWIYWLTIAGPILSEGRQEGYWHIVPFFVGGLVGFYGAATFAVWLLAWGASLHKEFKKRILLAANLLLLLLAITYLLRAYWGH